MEKKYLNEFVELFDKFSFAVGIVARGCDCTCAPDPACCEKEMDELKKITDDLIRCHQLYEGHEDWNILYGSLNEINQNLWNLSTDDRILYLKSIIRKFENIAPYTNNDRVWCIENLEIGACSTRGDSKQYLYLFFIKQFLENDPPYNTQTIVQHHISLSARTLYFFESKLSRICQDFNINFIQLQDDLGIYLRQYMGCDSNEDYAYFELSETQNQSLSAETSSTLIIGEIAAIEPIALFKDKGLIADFKIRILKVLREDKYTDEQNKWIYEKNGKLCFIPLRDLVKWMIENGYFKHTRSGFYADLKKYFGNVCSVDLGENLQRSKINKANSNIWCSLNIDK